MANLKEIRNRITSIGSTMQITNAMKMVSAAKLKKTQDAVTHLRPYANKLTELLQGLSSNLDESSSIYTQQREVNKLLLISITSNRGLCGSFNSSVIKATLKLINTADKGIEVDVLAIGKKGFDILSKTQNVITENNDVFDNLTYENVSAIADELLNIFAFEKYDKIMLVYNKFKNAATQITTVEQFLPIDAEIGASSLNLNYIFEPSQQFIVEQLIPKYLKMHLYKAIRDSFAAEHGARMTAMHKATDNATDLRNELLLTYNKARQAAITNEILEIVGGAEALNN